MSLRLLVAVPAFLSACAAPAAAPDPAPDPDRCAFDDVAFDPHGGLVLQAENDVACVRLEREPLADVRRGTEWRALSLAVVVDDRVVDVQGDALAYENSHHNCRDVVSSAEPDVELAIDGVSDDPSVCFDGAPEAWRLVLSVNGETHVLVPR